VAGGGGDGSGVLGGDGERGGDVGGGGDGAVTCCSYTMGGVTCSTLRPRLEEKRCGSVLERRAAAKSAEAASAITSRASTTMEAGVTVRVASSAAGKSRSKLSLKAVGLNVPMSPATVKATLTTERRVVPGEGAGGGDGGGG
jgi:hypothetical protein